ncbi:MAG: arginine--tRNA ligase, partial [bacterium]|nr:arginine--tRNA ligase [bacterium]
ESVDSVSLAGPGFININLSRKYFVKSIQEILERENDYGRQEIGKGKTILVEYSSPNIAKPFTVGHLRSTIIGDAIANILDSLGYTVVRDNHLGDWGTQFGKLLVSLEKWGDIGEIEKSESPIKDLASLYVRFHTEAENDSSLEDMARLKFQELENGGNGEIQEIWKKCIDLSKKEFERIYEQLGVEFDTQIGESFYATKEMTDKVVKELESKDLIRESEGAQVVFFEGEKYPPLIIKKTDGTSIYATRDLATDLYRKERYGNDLTILNEVGSEQALYFKQLYETEKMLGWFREGDRVHIAHGLLRLKEGKISTRKGNAIWLEDSIKEAVDRANKINPESTNEVAMAALKFNDLKRDSPQDIIFDWDEMMSMTGDSGPYLQYSCARARSVLAKAEELKIKTVLNADSKSSPALENLEKLLVRFPETVERAGREYKANILASYLINLGAQFNHFYANNIIADEKDADAPHKAALTKAFSIVMTNGLRLLGIKVPKRM